MANWIATFKVDIYTMNEARRVHAFHSIEQRALRCIPHWKRTNVERHPTKHVFKRIDRENVIEKSCYLSQFGALHLKNKLAPQIVTNWLTE